MLELALSHPFRLVSPLSATQTESNVDVSAFVRESLNRTTLVSEAGSSRQHAFPGYDFQLPPDGQSNVKCNVISQRQITDHCVIASVSGSLSAEIDAPTNLCRALSSRVACARKSGASEPSKLQGWACCTKSATRFKRACTLFSRIPGSTCTLAQVSQR